MSALEQAAPKRRERRAPDVIDNFGMHGRGLKQSENRWETALTIDTLRSIFRISVV